MFLQLWEKHIFILKKHKHLEPCGLVSDLCNRYNDSNYQIDIIRRHKHIRALVMVQIIRLLTDKQLQQAVTQPLNPNTLEPVTITEIYLHA